jgi:catechol 2,3-dioxygenase-like lactoylglutathione lyase family enzyme
MIGRLHHLVLDCPEPDVLARFYSELLGWPVTWQQPDFAVVAVNERTSGLAFQRAADYRAPDWPDPARPQQLHVDVMVDDLDEAEPQVLALGARRLIGPDSQLASDAASASAPTSTSASASTSASTSASASASASASRVFADPAGHPFCLIPRPSWAPPVHPADGSGS